MNQTNIYELIESNLTTEELLKEIDNMDCLFSGQIQAGSYDE